MLNSYRDFLNASPKEQSSRLLLYLDLSKMYYRQNHDPRTSPAS